MSKTILTLAVMAIVLVAIVGIAVSSYTTVESGHIGVLKTWGETDMEPKPEGFHWIIPMAQKITPMSIQIQKYVSDTESASKDLQTVRTQVTVNHHLLPSKVPYIFQNLGLYYEDRIINPAVEETVKQVTANYNAEELITKRPLVKSAIEESITQRLAKNDIIVDHISITDFNFSEDFNRAIEQKVTAEQQALTAQNQVAIKEAEARQRVAEAEGIANSKIAVAKGEAEAVKLAGDAEAYAINVKAEALRNNPDILTLENIQRWNGILPYFYSSGADGKSPQLLLNIEKQQ